MQPLLLCVRAGGVERDEGRRHHLERELLNHRTLHAGFDERTTLPVMHVILPSLVRLASMSLRGFLLAGMGVPGCLLWWG